MTINKTLCKNKKNQHKIWMRVRIYHYVSLVWIWRECEYTGVKTPGAAVLTPHRCSTQSDRPVKSHFSLVLKRELLQLLECDEENDVPRSQSQPVGPESLIESKESLILPRLHHSIQCSFVHWTSRQNSLVHHTGTDHVYRVGGQRPR